MKRRRGTRRSAPRFRSWSDLKRDRWFWMFILNVVVVLIEAAWQGVFSP